MKKKTIALSFLTKEEKMMLKELSPEKQAHIKYMREDTARNYINREYKKLHPSESSDLMVEFKKMLSNIDDNLLSKKNTIKEKNFACKFCGTRFSTEESRDKHQKICM